MRWLGILVVLVAPLAYAAPASNPAFLGIEMDPTMAGCAVVGVTACSPARDAGLRLNDIIVGMDGKSVVDSRRAACDVLRERIMAHAPNDLVTYDVRRGGGRVTLKATLSTRADVQHRCFVGQTLAPVEVADLDNEKHTFDLGELRGRTTVIGWIHLGRCDGCGAVFDAIADGIKSRLRDSDPPAQVLGMTPFLDPPRKHTRNGFGSTVPIALMAPSEFEKLTLKESGERIQFMVVDCRGVIRFVAPIAPGSDDLDAAVDEVLAAVEQAERLRMQRR